MKTKLSFEQITTEITTETTENSIFKHKVLEETREEERDENEKEKTEVKSDTKKRTRPTTTPVVDSPKRRKLTKTSFMSSAPDLKFQLESQPGESDIYYLK